MAGTGLKQEEKERGQLIQMQSTTCTTTTLPQLRGDRPVTMLRPEGTSDCHGHPRHVPSQMQPQMVPPCPCCRSHCSSRGVGLDDCQRSFLTHTTLAFLRLHRAASRGFSNAARAESSSETAKDLDATSWLQARQPLSSIPLDTGAQALQLFSYPEGLHPAHLRAPGKGTLSPASWISAQHLAKGHLLTSAIQISPAWCL